MKKTGILITNVGTPNSPSVADVHSYLKTFLSDKRVVRLPGFLWKPLLNTVILPLRARSSAELYQRIWTKEGSPLRVGMYQLAENLQTYLSAHLQQPIFVEPGMHYGKPSIEEGIEKLCAKNIEQLFVLPLFPHYSFSTTETTCDQVKKVLKSKPALVHEIKPYYADHPAYINALCQSIKEQHTSGCYLLFSFHGLPQRFVDGGDPYQQLCLQTANQVASNLQLPAEAWSVAFQSRFGYAKWLTPYTFETLEKLAQQGIDDLAIVCPGFSLDCLETLEEIQIRGKERFVEAGGKTLHYIPALNANREHVEALAEIIKSEWLMAS